MASPTSWDKRQINAWWQRSIDKERQRQTNTPKPHRGDRTSVPEDFSNFAPPLPKPKRDRWHPMKASHGA